MSVDENIKLGFLLDTYGELLSEKQKQVLYNYINNDMSLREIADDSGVSRSAVLDSVNAAKRKLFDFENKLKLCEIKSRLTYAISQDDKTCKSEVTKLLEEM